MGVDHPKRGDGVADDGSEPLVSVCVPTFNRGEYLADAISSALQQTYENIEIVIADDGSDDVTGKVLDDAARDPRVRVLRNPTRLGHVRNRNHVVHASRGSLIKFLDDDDLLHPTCVAEMVSRFVAHPELGFVFCRRRVISGADDDAERAAFEERYGALHTGFTGLGEVNAGAFLFKQWIVSASENWVGEPTTVMVKRDLFIASGGFNPLLHQSLDVDLWLRLFLQTNVGFVDEELVSYRVGHARVSTANADDQRGVIDRLWMFEILWRQPAVAEVSPVVYPLLIYERVRFRAVLARLIRSRSGRRVLISDCWPYLRWRLKRFLLRKLGLR